jgi:hypothetical protein
MSWVSILFLVVLMVPLFPNRTMAVPIQVQPIAVMASNSYPGCPGINAVDGNPSTVWNAGGNAPQWIQLDFGKTIAIGKIRLLTHQAPNGNTTHEVWAGQDPSSLRKVKTFTGFAVA